MKKLFNLSLFSIFSFFSLMSLTFAETIFNVGLNSSSEYSLISSSSWTSAVYDIGNSSVSCNSESDCYSKALDFHDSTLYDYYSMYITYNSNSSIVLHIYSFNITSSDFIIQNTTSVNNSWQFWFYISDDPSHNIARVSSSLSSNKFYVYYDSNYLFYNTNGDYSFSNFYDTSSDPTTYLKLPNDSQLPKLKDLLRYTSYSEYISSYNYTSVDLDSYEYVVLSLKDYSTITPFESQLQVKGQIGITPVYNFGQSSKDSITGSQVQDRCNPSYSSFTPMSIYINQNDLYNNSVFYIKSCSSGSSFKFDNTIFDITYITSSNVNNPSIVIGNETYNIIPYSQLPSTATTNEDNNYIPGQSGASSDTGGLDEAIKTARDSLSQIWDSFSYFISFVSQLFSALPPDLRGVLLSAFVVAITLGIIKIFVN